MSLAVLSNATDSLLTSPYFAIFLTIGAYMIGVWLRNKTKLAVLLPFITAVVIIIAFLKLTGISYDVYMLGGRYMAYFSAPTTVILALPIYLHLRELRQNLLPAVIGILAGVVISFLTVYIPCRIFGVEKLIYFSMLPHSVTNPIAVPLSKSITGNSAITVFSLIISGSFGAAFAPLLVKIFRIKGEIATGVALGTASHVIGTSKAFEFGETAGAFSGLSLGLCGIVTTICLPIFIKIFVF